MKEKVEDGIFKSGNVELTWTPGSLSGDICIWVQDGGGTGWFNKTASCIQRRKRTPTHFPVNDV